MRRLIDTCLALPLLVSLAACPSADDGTADEATETSGTDTTSGECVLPDGVYGDCVAGGDAACMAAGDPFCVTDTIDNPSIGVCTQRCEDTCECWAAPATGTAEVACTALVDGDPTKSCVLDCSSGQTCPDGMECLDPLQICVWPS